MSNTPIEIYRRNKGQEFIQIINDMMSCGCADCSKIKPRDRYSAIAHALIDSAAEHIFAGCQASVQAGEMSMIAAHKSARALINKCFEEFQSPQTWDQNPNNQGENNG